MDFANVTDITIPEGSVEKITETVGGRVLWEKNKLADLTKAHWQMIDTTNFIAIDKIDNMRGFGFIDTGDGVEVFSMYDGDGSRFHLNTNGNLVNRYILSDEDGDVNSVVTSGDIDPISKVWCVAARGGKYAMSSNSIWIELPALGSGENTIYSCSWSPTLKSFCILGKSGSYLIDTQGNITGQKYTQIKTSDMTESQYPRTLAWSDKLKLFAGGIGGTSSTDKNVIWLSSDGLNWQQVTIPILGDITSNMLLRDIIWFPELEKFVTLCTSGTSDDNNLKVTFYSSSDGKNFEYVSSLSAEDAGVAGGFGNSLHYSPKQQALLFMNQNTSFLTRDLISWTNIPYPSEGLKQSGYPYHVIWSNSFNAFIAARYSPAFGPSNSNRKIAKLVF